MNREERLISIHALREEGDISIASSTRTILISIHALREEGDQAGSHQHQGQEDFYPRPPRGGRRVFSLDNNGQ